MCIPSELRLSSSSCSHGGPYLSRDLLILIARVTFAACAPEPHGEQNKLLLHDMKAAGLTLEAINTFYPWHGCRGAHHTLLLVISKASPLPNLHMHKLMVLVIFIPINGRALVMHEDLDFSHSF